MLYYIIHVLYCRVLASWMATMLFKANLFFPSLEQKSTPAAQWP